MSTTGTYNFDPALGGLVIDAFGNCGVRRTELTAQHMDDARFAANLITARWAASGVNLWAVDLQTVALVQGQATYDVPDNTIFILDAYITQGSPAIDTLIYPISRSDYVAISDKATQSTPSVFWFDRTLSPTVTLWAVPSQTGTWTLKYWRARQIQDSSLSNGGSVEMPIRFVDAFSWELSARMAVKYAPDRAAMLKQEAREAWDIAISSDTENVALQIQPTLAGYFR